MDKIQFLHAIKKNKMAQVREYLNQVSGDTDINFSDVDGNTPLHYACSKNNRSIVTMLIDRGANITATNIEGSCPIDCLNNMYNINWNTQFDGIDQKNDMSVIIINLIKQGSPLDRFFDKIYRHSTRDNFRNTIIYTVLSSYDVQDAIITYNSSHLQELIKLDVISRKTEEKYHDAIELCKFGMDYGM